MYIVKNGDTLSGIAVKFDTTVSEILALNPKMSSSTLVVGTVVTVPKPSPSPPLSVAAARGRLATPLAAHLLTTPCAAPPRVPPDALCSLPPFVPSG